MSLHDTFFQLSRMHPDCYAPAVEVQHGPGGFARVEGIGPDFRIESDGSIHGSDEFYRYYNHYDVSSSDPATIARDFLADYTVTARDFELPESMHYLETGFTTYSAPDGVVPLFWPDSGRPWSPEEARERLLGVTPEITGVTYDRLMEF